MIKFLKRVAGHKNGNGIVHETQTAPTADQSLQFNNDTVRPLTQEEIDAIVTQVRQVRAARQGRRSDIHLRRKIMQREAETAIN